jgi:hypothetical protein
MLKGSRGVAELVSLQKRVSAKGFRKSAHGTEYFPEYLTAFCEAKEMEAGCRWVAQRLNSGSTIRGNGI